MKKIYTLITVLFINIVVFTVFSAPPPPVPEKMSYQAVIRNSSNALVASHLVGMRISILQSTSTGTAVYVETQTPTTNVNGLATIEIGKGTIVSGVFSNIDWSAGPYFIKTETDPAGGTAYTITVTSELISVPYALMAKNAKSATNLTLPFSNSGSYTTTPFSITNTGSTYYTIAGYSTSGYGIYGKTNDDNSSGVIGDGSGANSSTGVVGRTGEGTTTTLPGNSGVLGEANAHIGVAGTALSGTAGYFSSNSGLALNTIGKLKLTGIGEAAGKILTSDATGNASWKDKSTKVSAFQPVGCQYLHNVTTTWQKIADMGTASKSYADTWLELTLQTSLYVDVFLTSCTGVEFQLRVDGVVTTIGNATALVKYPTTVVPVSITGVFNNLTAGSHTVSLWARSSNGNATDAYYDPGCYNSAGINNVLIKEFY